MLPELFAKSEIMILDFSQLSSDLPEYKNIQKYFSKCIENGINPKLPENRQKFNNEYLERTGNRYLISRYAEDRIEMLRGSQIEKEGRTIHMGIDIFSRDLEDVFAPSDGEIVAVGKEEGDHSFGHYLIFKPEDAFTKNYIFLGHLSANLPNLGKVRIGEIIATLGDFVDGENGGWSRHLHVQLLAKLPDIDSLPLGYSTKSGLSQNMLNYPDPSFLVFK